VHERSRQDYYGNAALCTIVHRAVKTDEPVMMPFGILTRMGRENHVLDGGPHSTREWAILREKRGRLRKESLFATKLKKTHKIIVYITCPVVDIHKATQHSAGGRPVWCGADADWCVLDGVHIGTT